MPGAMPDAMLGNHAEQTTQRNATDERNVRLQDSPKNPSVPDPGKPVDNRNPEFYKVRGHIIFGVREVA